MALGAYRLIRRSWPSATFVIVMAICPPITFTVAFFRKFLLYENYVIYSLPGRDRLRRCRAHIGRIWLAKLSGRQTSG